MYGLTMGRRGLLGSIVGFVCRVFAGFVTVAMLLVPDQTSQGSLGLFFVSGIGWFCLIGSSCSLAIARRAALG